MIEKSKVQGKARVLARMPCFGGIIHVSGIIAQFVCYFSSNSLLICNSSGHVSTDHYSECFHPCKGSHDSMLSPFSLNMCSYMNITRNVISLEVIDVILL